jgi:hypothetical protein
MDNTITALQNLYVALGGTASDVANVTIIPGMINAIADQVTANKAAAAETTEEEKDND